MISEKALHRKVFNRKQDPNFEQVGGLVTTNSRFFFIASHALLQRYAEFNRLYKRIFLDVLRVSLIFPWFL